MSQITESAVKGAPKPMTPFQEFWHYFKRNKGAVVGLVYIVLMLVIALGAGVLPLRDGTEYPTDPYEGMTVFRQDTGVLEAWTGAWEPFASATNYKSVRRIATTIRTTNTSTFTSETVINNVTATLESGKTYRVVWKIGGTSSVTNDVVRFRIREDNISGTQMQLRNAFVPVATSAWPVDLEAEFTAASSGSKTFTGTAQRVIGTGNITCTANANEPAYLYVDYVRG